MHRVKTSGSSAGTDSETEPSTGVSETTASASAVAEAHKLLILLNGLLLMTKLLDEGGNEKAWYFTLHEGKVGHVKVLLIPV